MGSKKIDTSDGPNRPYTSYPGDAKKVFKKSGTCSRTFFYLLNREFGSNEETRERAADPLAGGIMQSGQQCGMLWGASLAIGQEAYRRCDNLDQAKLVAIRVTERVMNSFAERENTIFCRDITRCDFKSRWSFAKLFLTGRFRHCFNLADQWAPEAIEEAKLGLAEGSEEMSQGSWNCASETVRMMGASEEEQVVVAGFAGGLGLSGAGCGALAAAIWIRTLEWCRENPDVSALKNDAAQELMSAFENVSPSKIRCSELTGRWFGSIEEHVDFIREGGCAPLIEMLSAPYDQEDLKG